MEHILLLHDITGIDIGTDLRPLKSLPPSSPIYCTHGGEAHGAHPPIGRYHRYRHRNKPPATKIYDTSIYPRWRSTWSTSSYCTISQV